MTLNYTPRHALPWPDGAEKVKFMDERIRDLALALDGKVGRQQATTGTATRYTGLCGYEESNPNLAGYIVIQTNMTMLNTMTRIDVKGWGYVNVNNIIDLTLTFYPFATDNLFYNYEVRNNGTMRFSNIEIMRRTSDGKIAIGLLPEPTTNSGQWHYPKLFVDAMVGHSNVSDAAMSGWSMSRVANLSAYTLGRSVNPDKPYAVYHLSTATLLGSGSWATVGNWGAVISHPLIGYSAGSFTLAQSGLYSINASVMFRNDSTNPYQGVRGILLVVNGASIGGTYASAKNDDYSTSTFSDIYPVKAGQTVAVQALQNSGANLNLHNGYWTRITMHRVD